ncbi:CRISPR-associated endonuclease Cas2 [Candidatus Pacearchaeota archaeon CG_4_9_14_0_2_um_filter_39_13]|nr:CRISPR-associated endonuclease Cas2 [Candidatus Pacearchaeota archaeon]OIO44034.1 MAG: CRISPR-associated endonuclease Cas2 [Candidatus Pacearchaeota archaeon CG1_02_39_14]PJC44500.1 MAG: CRISPR-associated endonuclease Cas2 [Candidatus Pacearchaeota archaeon CG_4_9_14_0_2_um_filter_39_13]QBM01493.1 CRISPR-associated endoribonuclease Cas2 [uncultured archaeon]
MLYWLIYDISENKTRNKIASKCKNYGFFRVQKSSFMADISKNRMEMLALEIRDLELGEQDCVFIIPSCKSCFSDKEIMGVLDEERVKSKEFVIVGR